MNLLVNSCEVYGILQTWNTIKKEPDDMEKYIWTLSYAHLLFASQNANISRLKNINKYTLFYLDQIWKKQQ